MKKIKYVLLAISISIFCLILAGCAVNAKYTTAATMNVGVADFSFDDTLIHPDVNPADNICDLCGKQLCDHTERTNHPAVPHTCTVDGTKEYWSCNGCGLLFDAASGGNTVAADDLVDPASHNFVNAVCTVCGQKLLYGGYINWVNNNQFTSDDDAKVTEAAQPVHSSLPSKILPTSRILKVRGWIIMEGDITGYGYSVDGGEWKEITSATYTGANDIYPTIFPDITNPGTMEKSGFDVIDGGLSIDLSEYLGQCVSVKIGAKGNLTGTQYVPVVTINNVHVKTGFASDIATIDGVEYGGIGTHLSGGVLHQNVTAQDDALLDIGGWMMADGGQGDLKWSVDGGINWFDPTVNYIDGGTGHTTSAGANAGYAPAGWELADAAFEAQLDLTAYKGKTITVTLGRIATDTGECIAFGYMIITVPGTASHVCTGNNWTYNGGETGTHTGYCTECRANVTEACAAASGVYGQSGTEHWQSCAKCSAEIANTRDTHVHPAQKPCDQDELCTVCDYKLGDAGSHIFEYTSNNNLLSHTVTCKNCSYSEAENCSGGVAATCNTHSACDKCTGAYGSLNPDAHTTATTHFIDNGNGTHREILDCCSAEKAINPHTITLMTAGNGTYHVNKCTSCDFTENVNCSGGSADCQNKAVCSVCSQPYGEVNGSVHAQATTHFVNNNNGTHSELYDCCNAVKEAVNHTYGSFVSNNAGSHVRTCTVSGCGATDTAACTSDGKFETNDSQHWTNCSTCGYDMGKTNHNYGTTYSDNGNGTHSRTCECSKVLTENCVSNNIYVTTDATYHWTNCTNCGSTMNYEKHDLKYGGTKDIHKYCATAGCGYIMTDHSEAITSRVVTEPTCTEQGYTTITCLCTYVYKDNYVTALGHNVQYYGTAEIHKKCTRCNDATTASHEGSYTETSRTNATCTSTGVVNYKCSCGYTFSKTLAMLSHSGGEATCQTQATCSNCGTKYGNKADHSYANNKQLSAATCTAAEVRQWTCKWCGAGAGTYTSGNALGHSWSLNQGNFSVSCTRGCNYTPKTFISPGTMDSATNAGYNTHKSDSNVNGTYMLFNATHASGAVTVLSAGSHRYAVIIYGYESGYANASSATFAIQAGVNQAGVNKTYNLQKAGSAVVRTECLDFGQNCDTLYLYTNVNATEVLVWGISMFDSRDDAEAYQDALATIAIGPNKLQDAGWA